MDEELLPESLTAKGRSLEAELGVDEIAWPQEVVFDVIACLHERGAVILGGDVYVDHDGKLTSAYANWACERLPGETLQVHSVRSAEKATEYIRSYTQPLEGKLYFVLVASTSGL